MGNRELSGDRDRLVEVDVLYGVEKLNAFFHRTLECLATGDEAATTGTLVDHRGADCLREIILAGSATGVDETDPPHVAVGNLPTTEVDRMIGGQFLVHSVIELSK